MKSKYSMSLLICEIITTDGTSIDITIPPNHVKNVVNPETDMQQDGYCVT